ncbi:hypothetical protein [Streptomyces sp. NBC_01766]|uniref:hypothetical protein n=1 Tax=Streptomyces sp. NBC_01766 TaxID=2975936 RepID=UPI003FA3980F
MVQPVADLLAGSAEFARLWAAHDVRHLSPPLRKTVNRSARRVWTCPVEATVLVAAAAIDEWL